MKQRLVLIALMLAPFISKAQNADFRFLTGIVYDDKTRMGRDFYSMYASVGTSAYYGELATISSFFNSGVAGFNFQDLTALRATVGVNYRLRVFRPLTLRGEFSYYRISATDRPNTGVTDATTWRYNKRGLTFRADNFEFWAGPQIDIAQYGGGRGFNTKQYKVSTYIYGGIGFTTNGVQGLQGVPEYDNNGVNQNQAYTPLRPIHSSTGIEALPAGQSFGGIAMIAPVGIGLKMRFVQFLDVGIDLGYRFAFTDYLDGVGGGSVLQYDEGSIEHSVTNPTGLLDSEIRGVDNNDGYLFTSLVLQYNFQNGIISPSGSLNRRRRRAGGSIFRGRSGGRTRTGRSARPIRARPAPRRN